MKLGLLELIFAYNFLWYLTVVIIHLFFSIGVYQETINPQRRIVLVPPVIWILSTLVFGPVVGCLFWIIHHFVHAKDGSDSAFEGPISILNLGED